MALNYNDEKPNEIVLAAGQYAKISLRSNPQLDINLIWWVIEVLGERIEIRDQDYCDLKDLILHLDKNPKLVFDKMYKLKRN